MGNGQPAADVPVEFSFQNELLQAVLEAEVSFTPFDGSFQ